MKQVCLLFLLFFSRSVLATHLLGGYIQVQQAANSAQQCTFRVILFMNEVNGKVAAEQTASLQVCFGDGGSGVAQRAERVLLSTDPDVSRNMYTVSHTYAGPGTYTVICLINQRTDGLGDPPNAVNVPLGLSTTFSTNVSNNTPVLPIGGLFRGAVNQKLTLSFRATDAEGDSLIYVLSKPQTATNSTSCVSELSLINPYLFPNDVSRRGTFKINAHSGDLTWNASTQVGRFDFAISVQEWRNGVLLSQTQYEQVIVVVDQAGGTPGTIPPYEPAQLTGEGIITGVTESEDYHNMAMSVFPVPVHEQFQVRLTLAQSSSVTLQLIDPAGRTVYEEQQKTPVLQHVGSIDVRTLSPGLYFLRASVNGQTVTRKVLKR